MSTLTRCRAAFCLIVNACSALGLAACGSGAVGTSGSRPATIASGAGAAPEGAKINQAELQQNLQRIATQFQSRVSQASLDLQGHPDAKVREAASQQALLYQSSILDIATGPQPEVNLLDLLVFARLNADALQGYWIPEVLGEAGKPLGDTFSRLELQAWSLAARILGAAEQQQVRNLVQAWQRQNPGQFRVEGVRLMDFGAIAGEAAAARAQEVRGLLGNVRSATLTADQAMLLADRALFLLQRVPFLLRAQVRLGAREVVGDTLVALEEVQSSLQSGGQLRSLLSEASVLVLHAERATQQARGLSDDLGPLLERAEPLLQQADGLLTAEELQQVLSASDRLSERMLLILGELERMEPASQDTIAELSRSVDALVRRWILYAALAAAGCTLFFWVCYCVAKRLAAAR